MPKHVGVIKGYITVYTISVRSWFYVETFY